jgi:hypothetical protein
MNTVTKIFQDIPDDELKLAVLEIAKSDTTGIMESDSIVRKYAKITTEVTNNSTSTDLFMVQINLLKQAAFRWASN